MHLAATSVATLQSVNVQPVVGNDAVACERTQLTGAMCTSLELFLAKCDGSAVYLMQQRGPVATGRHAAFCAELADWARSAGFAEVLLLSSTDASARGDGEIEGPQLALLRPPTAADAACAQQLEAAGVPRWEDSAAAHELDWRKRRAGPWCDACIFHIAEDKCAQDICADELSATGRLACNTK